MLRSQLKLIVALIVLTGTAAYAQKAPLKTSDVAVDANGICWVRGPANVMVQTGVPLIGAALTVTATTVLPTAGNWLVISTTGTPTIVLADGTTTVAGAAGTAYPL